MPDKFLLKALIPVFVFLFALQPLKAQTKDTISHIKKDSSKGILKKSNYPDPKVAMICSAIVPGLGQAYNHKYWKMPIVYAGIGTMIYFISYNQALYVTCHNAIHNPQDNLYKYYTASDLVTIEAGFERDRNLSIIGALFIYMLNIVDANVDAQFHHFDVSDNISFHFTPQLNTDITGKPTIQPGLSFAFKF
jgi:hypothetical protein